MNTNREWPIVKIGEFAEVIGGGTPSMKVAEYFGGDIPWITPRDLSGHRFRYVSRGATNLTERGLRQSSARLLPANAVLFSSRAPIGYVAIAAQPVSTNQGFRSLVCNLEKADPKFIYYALRYHVPAIESLASGATFKEVSGGVLKEFALRLPPLPTQRRIAAILSAYDDLIENNTRRIAILEAMAQSLYREWFVDLRFPGHEQAPPAESSNGPLPAGWRVAPLRELCSYINRGVSPKYDDSSSNLVINQKCIRNERLNLELARRHATKVPPDKVVRFGDVLVNSTGIGTLGRVAQVYTHLNDATVDSHVTIARPGPDLSIDYFGLAMLTLQPHFDSLGQGSTGQTELARERVAETPLLVPDPRVQHMFSGIVSPMRQLTVALAGKNANLRRTRDLLLPKLMSGEVDVTDMPIDTGGGDE